jgi:hypothetical protein
MLVEWLLSSARDNQGFPVATPYCSNQIAVHRSNELEGDFLGAHGFTLAMIRATAEVFVCHGDDHAESPLIALGLPLRKRVEMSNFGGGEKHSGCIRTSGDTGSAADACSSVHRSVRRFFWDQDHIGIRSASRGCADEAPGLNDSVEG